MSLSPHDDPPRESSPASATVTGNINPRPGVKPAVDAVDAVNCAARGGRPVAAHGTAAHRTIGTMGRSRLAAAARVALRYRVFLLIIAADAVIWAVRPSAGTAVFERTLSNFAEMAAVLPPIFLLIGLLDVWVPRETLMRFLGDRSGLLGVAISIVLGAAAAGPLYAAFPVAAIMMRKGAKFSNVIVFLGSWSTLKIPMALFEASALGARFAITRWIASVLGVAAMAVIIDRAVTKDEKRAIYTRHEV